VAAVLLATGVGLAQPTSTDPTFITEWGSYGSEDGRFSRPHSAAVGASGNIFVADTYNNRIQKFK
jgi:hypothetical protein